VDFKKDPKVYSSYRVAYLEYDARLGQGGEKAYRMVAVKVGGFEDEKQYEGEPLKGHANQTTILRIFGAEHVVHMVEG
jgi:hypothetical protein